MIKPLNHKIPWRLWIFADLSSKEVAVADSATTEKDFRNFRRILNVPRYFKGIFQIQNKVIYCNFIAL
jgi:hypothetical protein